MRKTSLEASTGDSSESSAKDAVLPVARRLQGHPFSLDPVVVQVVGALLEHHFRTWKISPVDWSRVSRQIATTLFDDPIAHERLKDFWTRLLAEC